MKKLFSVFLGQKSLSWQYFTLLFCLFILLMNVKLFSYLYEGFDFGANFALALALPVIYFVLLCVIFSLLFVPYFTKPLAILCVVATCLSAYFMLSYGVIIDSEMLRNAFKTDSKEVLDLLNLKFILFITLLALLPSLLIWRVKIEYFSLKKHLKIKALLFFSSLIILGILLFALSKAIVPFFRVHKDARVYNAPFYQFYSLAKFAKTELSPKPEFMIFSKDAHLSGAEAKGKKLLIFVLGETARAANYSLGTYTRNPVNEYIQTEDIVYFDKVSSCGTATAKSVPCMFSFSKQKEHSSNEFRENVLDVLQNVGVNVVWLDNNSGGCQGVCERLKKVRLFKEDYDAILLEELGRDLMAHSLEQNNLYVLHLQGSHGPAYYKRYPKEFQRFKPTCDTNDLSKCSEEQIFNTYDNTLYYTDYLVEELVDFAVEQEYEVSVLYISDHGESLGERGVYLHGLPYAIAPKEQTHIPLIIYSNDKTTNENLKSKRHLALSHDNIASTLLGYFGVQSPLYESTYDIFSPNLRENE